MTESNDVQKKTKAEYRAIINQMGKKEFTLLKMQEYGFWPKEMPTPYERQQNESIEDYENRQKLTKEYKKVIDQIADLYQEKDEINKKLRELRKRYDETWDIEKIRMDIAQTIMKESIARRAERKKQKELEKQQKSEAWQKKKAEQIVFIGKGYSSMLNKFDMDVNRLTSLNLPIIKTDKELANFLDIDYNKLRFLAYHRDVVSTDHYVRYKIPKRSDGIRSIAAPKKILKSAQRKILDEILSKIAISEYAHGFIKGKSVVTGANSHLMTPGLVINIDIEDFFPTITFERIRGMLLKLGFSGHISSLIAIICTFCERIPIEVKGKTKYVAITRRILPQGSPASPMITNVICRRLDKRLKGLANKFGCSYTRYADDMSFAIDNEHNIKISRFMGLVSKIIKEEGFKLNPNKTRYLRKNNRQSITGVVINNPQLGLPRKWIRNFRAAIHNANKLRSNGEISIEIKREISGMAAWVRCVNPKRYEKLLNAANEIIK